MSAHTPGSWEVDQALDTGGFARLQVIATASSTGRICVLSRTEEDQANARLIAAAPELLELVRDLLNAHEGAVYASDDPFPDDLRHSAEWVERIRAVFAKMEGR